MGNMRHAATAYPKPESSAVIANLHTGVTIVWAKISAAVRLRGASCHRLPGSGDAVKPSKVRDMQDSPSGAPPADDRGGGRHKCSKCLRLLATMAFALTASFSVAAPGDDAMDPASDVVWRLALSPFTHHYHFDVQHKLVFALGVEREAPDHSLFGLTAFSNSFGQPSAYGYYGRVYDKVWDRFDSLYLQWTIGVIYGYKVPFDDKINYNYHGFAPAIIPAVGWRLDKDWSVQVNLLGTSAVMLMVTKKLQ